MWDKSVLLLQMMAIALSVLQNLLSSVKCVFRTHRRIAQSLLAIFLRNSLERLLTHKL